jgi:hypothetical protein
MVLFGNMKCDVGARHALASKLSMRLNSFVVALGSDGSPEPIPQDV